MASNTPNYNLIKPNPSEFYDVDVNNQNMDTIDAELKNNADDISSAGQSLDNHKLDTTNPHQVNKSQVGLGNVDNVQQASKSEFNILSNDFTSHQANKANPHNVTKSQIGLENVDNIKQATKTEFDTHVNDKDNPHNVTKSQIGLSSVNNYGVATQTEAETGTSDNKYMTPLKTKQAIEKLAPQPDLTDLNNHLNNKSNPHGVTKSQVGLGNVDNVKQASKTEFETLEQDFSEHQADKANPHNVTSEQINLIDRDNYTVNSKPTDYPVGHTIFRETRASQGPEWADSLGVGLFNSYRFIVETIITDGLDGIFQVHKQRVTYFTNADGENTILRGIFERYNLRGEDAWGEWQRVLTQQDYDELFQYGNNVKSDTVGALLSVDDSLPIDTNSSWGDVIGAIGQISTGKKWASGTTPSTERDSIERFTGSNITGNMIVVDGLDFEPSIIVMRSVPSSDLGSHVTLYCKNFPSDTRIIYANSLYSSSILGYSLKDKLPMYVNNTGFKIMSDALSSSWLGENFDWIAIE